MQNGNTNVDVYDVNIYETKVCNFLHVDGAKIGTYCGAEAPWWDGNRLRCDAHLDAYWPNATYQCVRIISRGARKGSACGSNTKFADGVCSRCRKSKRTIVRAVPIEQVTPIVVPQVDLHSSDTIIAVDGFPIYYPVEDGTDGRHPCECPMINMPRQSAILV